VFAHIGGIPVEEALLAAPALVTGLTVIAGFVRATWSDPGPGSRTPETRVEAANSGRWS